MFKTCIYKYINILEKNHSQYYYCLKSYFGNRAPFHKDS